MWEGKKKAAVYLRRSQGDTGDTKEQLKRINKALTQLEKQGKIRKLNRSIVGRSLGKGGERFNKDRDLALKGDIFNEGDGQTAFDSSRDRVVLNELLRRMDEGQYEVVIAESLDRFSRDPLDFARALNGTLLDRWRRDGWVFWGLSDNQGYGTKIPFNEAIITTKLMWGGESKKQEGEKSKKSLDEKLDKGFVQGRLKASFAGDDAKNAGIDYRALWNLMQAYGHTYTKDGDVRLKGAGDIGKEYKMHRSNISRLYRTFLGWNSVKLSNGQTALDAWLDAVAAINDFIRAQPFKYAKSARKSPPVVQLLKTANGFLNFPAGLNPSVSYPRAKDFFIEFPNPTDFDFELLSITDDPRTIPNWEVKYTPMKDIQFVLIPEQMQVKAKARNASKK